VITSHEWCPHCRRTGRHTLVEDKVVCGQRDMHQVTELLMPIIRSKEKPPIVPRLGKRDRLLLPLFVVVLYAIPVIASWLMRLLGL